MPEKMKGPASSKQTLMILAVVVVFGIILWQLKGLFWKGGGSSEPIKPVTQQPAKAKMTGNAPQAMSSTLPATSPNTSMPSDQMMPSTPPSEIKQTSIIDTGVTTEEKAATQKYLGKVNELEELKIQKDIAETNQAIATAKLATVTAEKNISDLLTKPAPGTPSPVPTGAYAAQMTAPINAPTTIVMPPTPRVESAPPPLADYTVISVTMQLHKWSAVIGYQGKLFSVGVGDVLPPDNSLVSKISRDAVILKRNGKVRKISVVTSI